MGKCQISKSWSGLDPLSDAHAPKLLTAKRLRKIAKIHLPIGI